jgi:cobalt-zinc-cadmium efflux system membrane fusion protein
VLVKVGDRVRANQVLARFDNIEAGEVLSQYETARAEVARLKAQQAAATRQFERSRRLVDIGAVSQRELEASQAEQQSLEEAIRAQQSTVQGLVARLRRFGVDEREPTASSVTSIAAPFSGLVLSVASAPGEVVDPTTELFSVANLSSVYVQTQVYEKDLGRVRVGQQAVVSVSAYPHERFPGRIASLGGMIDPQSRTAPVRCEVDNSQGRLFVDMFATVELPISDSRTTLALPTEAVQQLDGKNVVFVQTAPDRFSVQPVEIGEQTGSLVEISQGLKAGQPVVVKAAFQVKSTLQAASLGEEEGEKK